MASDIYDTPEHELFRQTVRKFVHEELAPRAREFDEMGRIDKHLYKKMGDLGMLGLRYDPKWGGAGLDWSYTAVMFEEIVRCDNAGVTMGISVGWVDVYTWDVPGQYLEVTGIPNGVYDVVSEANPLGDILEIGGHRGGSAQTRICLHGNSVTTVAPTATSC